MRGSRCAIAFEGVVISTWSCVSFPCNFHRSRDFFPSWTSGFSYYGHGKVLQGSQSHETLVAVPRTSSSTPASRYVAKSLSYRTGQACYARRPPREHLTPSRKLSAVVYTAWKEEKMDSVDVGVAPPRLHLRLLRPEDWYNGVALLETD